MRVPLQHLHRLVTVSARGTQVDTHASGVRLLLRSLRLPVMRQQLVDLAGLVRGQAGDHLPPYSDGGVLTVGSTELCLLKDK